MQQNKKIINSPYIRHKFDETILAEFSDKYFFIYETNEILLYPRGKIHSYYAISLSYNFKDTL